jgi:hypothetical protein
MSVCEAVPSSALSFAAVSNVSGSEQRRYLVLDNSAPFFKTHRGIVNNKSELGTTAESLFPELSSPFQMSSATG